MVSASYLILTPAQRVFPVHFCSVAGVFWQACRTKTPLGPFGSCPSGSRQPHSASQAKPGSSAEPPAGFRAIASV
uniref:Uncharacterized protein n=1 Tax=Klebsiella pneumoniae TaxID=573 RepID=A0A1W5T8C0_KLEPN|nr:Hypothetical protein pKp41M_00049 [Klebsiella pneumoniae]